MLNTGTDVCSHGTSLPPSFFQLISFGAGCDGKNSLLVCIPVSITWWQCFRRLTCPVTVGLFRTLIYFAKEVLE